MKRKAKKPFIRLIRLDDWCDVQPWAEVLFELGYTLYELPTDVINYVFVSNVPLTQKWFKENHKRFNCKLYKWKPTEPDAELDEYGW